MPVLIERAVSFQWFSAPLVPALRPSAQFHALLGAVAALRSNTKAWDQVWEPARQKKDRRTKCRVFQPNPFYQLRSGYMSLVNPAARRIVDQLGRCRIDQEYFDALRNVNCSPMRLNIFWMAVELPMKQADILRPLGRISHTLFRCTRA